MFLKYWAQSNNTEGDARKMLDSSRPPRYALEKIQVVGSEYPSELDFISSMRGNVNARRYPTASPQKKNQGKS